MKAIYNYTKTENYFFSAGNWNYEYLKLVLVCMCVFYSLIPRPQASFPGLWPHSQASGLIPRPQASFPGLWPHSQTSAQLFVTCTASNTHKTRWGAKKKAMCHYHAGMAIDC